MSILAYNPAWQELYTDSNLLKKPFGDLPEFNCL